ncbi:MAG TPA: phospholipase D-like domain-containing protein, partial [Bacteroidales bacterium]|nr:phospholipase D-like domain-containing protein [Bacteroidales bacterium]
KMIISNRSTSDATVVTDLGNALGTNFKEYHEQGLLHSKAMIVDQSDPLSDPFVWTGSHNWSDAANVSNDENSIVIYDAGLCNLFYQEFKERFDLAIPISDHPVLDLGPDQTVFGGDTVTLDAGQFSTYVWSTGALSQIITVDSAGVGYGTKKIYCRVTDAYGVQSDTVRITFKPHDGIMERPGTLSALSVYPNPADGPFTIAYNSKGSQTAHIEIIGVDGKSIWSANVTSQPGKNLVTVTPKPFAAGVYFVRLRCDDSVLGARLVIR